MAKYSIKKCQRRNVKKYKKSRRGCGKRSLRGGKTRKYKVFKNIKRRTLGKRKGKRMVGGVDPEPEPWTFRVEPEKLKTYVNTNYRTNFDNLRLVAFGYVGITNRGKGYFLRADYRLEQIVVFACYKQMDTDIPSCYAIARCNGFCPRKGDKIKNDECPNFDMEKKILFFEPGGIEIKYPIEGQTETDDETNKAIKLLRKKLEERYREKENVEKTMQDIMMIEFTNTISSSDKYRMVLFPYIHSVTLKPFFSNVNSEYDPPGVQYPEITTRTQQQRSENNEQSYDSTGSGIIIEESIVVAILAGLSSVISH
jgi:hypothetical protein